MSDVQIARFSEISSQGARFAEEMGVPLGAYQKMTAEELFLVMSSPKLGGPFATDPGISADQDLVCAIVRCSPGQGPYLHAHYNTLENFICLDGRFRISWGDTGENEAFLDPFDVVSVPRGVVRAFDNASDQEANILAFIRGDTPEDFADVAMTPAAVTDLDRNYGTGTAEKIKDIGWRFDAGIDAPTAQVSADEMEERIARFSAGSGQACANGNVHPVMHPEAGRAAIAGDPGLAAQIIELSPDAPVEPYRHTRAQETVMCIGGDVSLALDGAPSGTQTLRPWDTATIAPGVQRHFTNAGDSPAFLLSMLTGGADESFDDMESA